MKQKIVHILQKVFNSGCIDFVECEKLNDYIHSLQSTKQQDNWIGVNDRLPEEDEEVLIFCGQYDIYVGQYSLFEDIPFWVETTEFTSREPSHWMPLPSPPKG